MEHATPGNQSRIPRVNSVPRFRRPAPVPDEKFAVLSTTMPLPQPPAPSSKGALPRGLKRPSPANLENVPEKKAAMAPPSDRKAKLPPWDLKGKLKAAEARIMKLKETAEKQKCEVEELRTVREILHQRVKTLETDLNEKTACLDEERRLHLECRERAARLQLKCDECEQKQRQTSLLLESTSQSLVLSEERNRVLCCELEDFRSSSSQREAAFSAQGHRLMEKETLLKASQEECSYLQEKVKSYEVQRKALHNKVMELKGNIRVFCRVRPLLTAETEKNSSVEHLIFVDDQCIDVYKGPKKIKNSFAYDRVFNPSSGQAEIFEELSELVQSVIDGYNVCVFAYGQTGSGKTYTMEGGLHGETRGMIPRSVDMIFTRLQEMAKVGWTYSVEASFLEIYNEQLRDLLHGGQSEKMCELRNPTSPGGDMVVTNLKVEIVESAVQVNDLLNIARTNRAVAATVHNDHSSRSHFIFKLRIKLSCEATGKGSDAILSLVDLAGSERLVDISENLRVTETKNINRSLSNLGNVILALSLKNEHVPYRNSKLTHLLQPCLGGNSKTLMLVNVSPREECIEESLNSLRFAMRVSECHIGQAKRKAQ